MVGILTIVFVDNVNCSIIISFNEGVIQYGGIHTLYIIPLVLINLGSSRLFKHQEISMEDERHKAAVESKKIDDGLNECIYTLEIPDCSVDDIGLYSLKVTNEYGVAESDVSIKLPSS